MKKQQAGQILSGLFYAYGFLRSRVGGLGKELERFNFEKGET